MAKKWNFFFIIIIINKSHEKDKTHNIHISMLSYFPILSVAVSPEPIHSWQLKAHKYIVLLFFYVIFSLFKKSPVIA